MEAKREIPELCYNDGGVSFDHGVHALILSKRFANSGLRDAKFYNCGGLSG